MKDVLILYSALISRNLNFADSKQTDLTAVHSCKSKLEAR